MCLVTVGAREFPGNGCKFAIAANGCKLVVKIVKALKPDINPGLEHSESITN